MTGSLHSYLWRDAEIARLFSPEAELAGVLRFEAALAAAQAASGIVADDAALAIEKACGVFVPEMEQLKAGIRRDGMIVPELIRQLRAAIPSPHQDALHLRSTSQDVIDTVSVLAIRSALEIVSQRLTGIISQLDSLRAVGAIPQMARTRMQRALPFALVDRIEAWQSPLRRHLERLVELGPRLLVIQIGGPIGIDNGPWIEHLARSLGLAAPSRSWHTARDGLAELASWTSLLTGSIGKLGQDIAMMAQNEIGEAVVAGGGKSSAMHHKSNPVAAEILVALARYNAAMLTGVHLALVHEQERSGAAWLLEWMTLPSMLETTGAALRHSADLLSRISFTSGVK
jgi:3-carboxy-cis,cis-muconate cycloisomerase